MKSDVSSKVDLSWLVIRSLCSYLSDSFSVIFHDVLYSFSLWLQKNSINKSAYIA